MDDWPEREFGRTSWGRSRHVVRTRPSEGGWPATAWCGARLYHTAGDDRVLCGGCENALAHEEGRRRARPQHAL